MGTTQIIIEVRGRNLPQQVSGNSDVIALQNAVNELRIGDRPIIRELLDKFVELYSAHYAEQGLSYSWRYKGPVARPVRRGDHVIHVEGRVGVVTGVDRDYIAYDVIAGDRVFDAGWRGSSAAHEFVHESDGAPVSGYDPS